MATSQHCAVLFADVSGSTRLYERLGNQLALALVGRCVVAMQQVTEACRGKVVKTIGDEVMAVFADADVACHAAIDMQIAVCSLPEAIEHGLTIHCGFHVGEVMIADGDVFGDTVNVAKRLAEVSKSGQIITSAQVVKLLPDALVSSTRFLDSDSVKGRNAPVELYEVLWEPDVELTEITTSATRHRPRLRTGMVVRYLGREYRVDENHLTLSFGRDARADVISQDKLASRNHCRIEKTRDKFTFLDFSSNGSFVQIAGREEVLVRRESILLHDRGTISFGRPVQSDPDAAVRFEIEIAIRS